MSGEPVLEAGRDLGEVHVWIEYYGNKQLAEHVQEHVDRAIEEASRNLR